MDAYTKEMKRNQSTAYYYWWRKRKIQIYLCVAVFLFLVLSIVGAFRARRDDGMLDDLEHEIVPSVGDEMQLVNNNHNNVIRIRNDLPGLDTVEEAETSSSSNDRRRNGRKDEVSNMSAIHRPLVAKHNSHHIFLDIGTPYKRQLLIVDTGSFHTAFPCDPCVDCGTHHANSMFYSVSDSSSSRHVTCGDCQSTTSCVKDKHGVNKCWLRKQYTEGSSWTGYEVMDYVWFGNSETEFDFDHIQEEHQRMSTEYVFGCVNSEQGMFKDQYADGIMGLGMSNSKSSIMQAFYDSGSIPSDAFALCFSRTGGIFSLGGPATSAHTEMMMYTDLVTSRHHGKSHESLYVVNIVSIFIGDEPVEGGFDGFSTGKGTVIDSGTTDTFLPISVAAPFRATWEKVTGMTYTNEEQILTPEQLSNLPQITFNLSNNVKWSVAPRSYMENISSSNTFKNRIYLDEKAGAVMGSNVMVDHDILFDIENQRLGLASANCDNII